MSRRAGLPLALWAAILGSTAVFTVVGVVTALFANRDGLDGGAWIIPSAATTPGLCAVLHGVRTSRRRVRDQPPTHRAR